MGLTTTALIQPSTRRFNNTQRSCQLSKADVLFNQTSAESGQKRVAGGIYKMNVRRPAPTPFAVGDEHRQGWIRRNFSEQGTLLGGAPCAGHTPKNTPPRGGGKILICGGCGLRNQPSPGTLSRETSDPHNHLCCKKCGSSYDFGNGSQETHQIFKDTVKGNRGAFACGGTNKPLGIYGTGTIVTREYTAAPIGIPGFEKPSQLRNTTRPPVFVVQPPPAVKSITVPARKNYSFSTSELIKHSGIGYDANLAIRGCGLRRPCAGIPPGDASSRGCNNCIQGAANTVCEDRSYYADGICPGGLTGGGQSCTTGKPLGGKRGSCECLSWTYKRNNAEYAHQGAVDSGLLIARQGRVTQVAEDCNRLECVRLERAKAQIGGDCNDCAGYPCDGLNPRVANVGTRRIPQELNIFRRTIPVSR